MELAVTSLAVYKTMQTIDALLPKEPMPWVKILASVLLGYLAAWVGNVDNLELSGLAVATLAGAVHSALRCMTLAGDYYHRRSLR